MQTYKDQWKNYLVNVCYVMGERYRSWFVFHCALQGYSVSHGIQTTVICPEGEWLQKFTEWQPQVQSGDPYFYCKIPFLIPSQYPRVSLVNWQFLSSQLSVSLDKLFLSFFN